MCTSHLYNLCMINFRHCHGFEMDPASENIHTTTLRLDHWYNIVIIYSGPVKTLGIFQGCQMRGTFFVWWNFQLLDSRPLWVGKVSKRAFPSLLQASIVALVMSRRQITRKRWALTNFAQRHLTNVVLVQGYVHRPWMTDMWVLPGHGVWLFLTFWAPRSLGVVDLGMAAWLKNRSTWECKDWLHVRLHLLNAKLLCFDYKWPAKCGRKRP